MERGRRPSPVPAFLRKARENLEDARAALAAGRHNACASRIYYAAFQAAVAALWDAGIRPTTDTEGTLSQRMVQAQWSGRLIYRRKLYPPELRGTLKELMELRLRGDYSPTDVPARQARRAVGAGEQLVRHVEARLRPPADESEEAD
jgi:uncharacterized protein (UPF0332 family)